MEHQVIFLALLFQLAACSHRDLSLENEMLPKPYTFGYKVHDKDGDQWRSEVNDGFGKVHGSYGYVDNYGLHREVQYVADSLGFRARIKTNEPGMDMPNPADVVMLADPPSDYDASIFGVENIIPNSGRSTLMDTPDDSQKYYKYQKFAEQSVPPVYVVDGHLQSPWFPMDTVAVV